MSTIKKIAALTAVIGVMAPVGVAAAAGPPPPPSSSCVIINLGIDAFGTPINFCL